MDLIETVKVCFYQDNALLNVAMSSLVISPLSILIRLLDVDAKFVFDVMEIICVKFVYHTEGTLRFRVDFYSDYLSKELLLTFVSTVEV